MTGWEGRVHEYTWSSPMKIGAGLEQVVWECKGLHQGNIIHYRVLQSAQLNLLMLSGKPIDTKTNLGNGLYKPSTNLTVITSSHYFCATFLACPNFTQILTLVKTLVFTQGTKPPDRF